jgi:hypothetical protein
MRRLIALLTCASLLASGCASTGATRVQAPTSDRTLLASYVRQLPVGSRVRVDLVDGKVVKGTLMKATDTSIVVQRRTRLPEPPDEFMLEKVASVQIESGNSTGRTIAIGAAAGAAAVFGALLILAAIFADD